MIETTFPLLTLSPDTYLTTSLNFIVPIKLERKLGIVKRRLGGRLIGSRIGISIGILSFRTYALPITHSIASSKPRIVVI
jgi:hypothetical protein